MRLRRVFVMSRCKPASCAISRFVHNSLSSSVTLSVPPPLEKRLCQGYQNKNSRRINRRLKFGAMFEPFRFNRLILLKQRQDVLRSRVRLSQHRRSGLNQDVLCREVCHFCGHVDVADAAFGGLQVLGRCVEVVDLVL